MRIAICDDEKRERESIAQYIAAYRNAHPAVPFEISAFSCGEELLAAYHEAKDFDFLFLDIQMKDIDGIQTAKEIRKTNKHAIIFFITGFTQYVSAAFTLNAFQFLLKPVKKEAFDREFGRALKQYFMEHQKYIIEIDSRTVALEIKDIVFLNSSDHYITIRTEQGKHIKRGKLNDEEKTLTPYGFVRTHNSFLVNMAYIFEITQKEVILKNGSRAALSARKRADVIDSFNSFLVGCAV